MLTNFPRCLANTLVEEGGWSNHPKDPGGATMKGVIQRVYDEYRKSKKLPTRSVRNISEGELLEIYRTNYWQEVAGDYWPKGPDQVVFDTAVNSGPSRSLKIAAKALSTNDLRASALAFRASEVDDLVGFVKKFCSLRGSFYRSLGHFSTFGKGWLRRNARMEALGIKMVLEDKKASPAPVVEREVHAAAKKVEKGKEGASGGAIGAGGSGAVAASGGWDWSTILMIGSVTLVCVLLIVFSWWYYRKHRERVAAYREIFSEKFSRVSLEQIVEMINK